MTLEFRDKAGSQIPVVQASGTLSTDDDVRFVPETERLIKLFGKIRTLLEMHDFHHR
jgi:hypothetical protein